MNTSLTVGEIAAQDYRKIEVFKKYGIDFCCGGKKSIEKVCHEKGISRSQLEQDLAQASGERILPSQDYNTWSIDFLADYIVQTHHQYVTRSLPVIFEYTQKVSRVHGLEHPEVVEVARLFMLVMDEISRHMMKEENILFPFIKQLVLAKNNRQPLSGGCFGSVAQPIRVMEHEHDQVGELMLKIREVTGNYQLPQGACNSYRYAYAKLDEFEQDLHQHIHLENNILFPKARLLEQELTGNSLS